MTFQQYAQNHLFNGGMFEDDAAAVIEKAQQEKALSGIKWSDDMEGYPVELETAFLYCLNKLAVEYIDSHTPMAWYRDSFVAA